jgi:hypothetical protein
LSRADEVRKKLARRFGQDEEAKRPGASGLFGVAVSAHEITERIGLQDDSNHNQTRRLEFLEESVSLLDAHVHTKVLDHTLRRYLHDFIGEIEPDRVPRFLLNDVVRYWRTIAVDYQAKVWGNGGTDWGLRYLKLIIPRKLTYAATLTTILTCGLETRSGSLHSATVSDLSARLQLPPLVRLAQLGVHLEEPGREALAQCLLVADEFVGWSEDPDWRASVKEVRDRRNQDPEVPAFRDARALARTLQSALETILFEDPLLKERSVRYLAM